MLKELDIEIKEVIKKVKRKHIVCDACGTESLADYWKTNSDDMDLQESHLYYRCCGWPEDPGEPNEKIDLCPCCLNKVIRYINDIKKEHQGQQDKIHYYDEVEETPPDE